MWGLRPGLALSQPRTSCNTVASCNVTLEHVERPVVSKTVAMGNLSVLCTRVTLRRPGLAGQGGS